MKKLLFILISLFFSNSSFGNYHASEINFEYNAIKNRVFIEVRYWRQCNDWPDQLIKTINIESAGCGSFTIPIDSTTITDYSLFRNKYPQLTCLKPNNKSKSAAKGVEEFIGRASFALDTAPFKNLYQNGCCKFYFSPQGLFVRPQEITTGISGLWYNYAMFDLCNFKASGQRIYRSPRFMQPQHSEHLNCNQPYSIDYGIDNGTNDSIISTLQPALGSSRTNSINPNSPLTSNSPISVYCLPGNTTSCQPIPNADPPIGFHVNSETGGLTFTPTDCNQVGVVVIQTGGYLLDTNNDLQLISLIRRDFMISTRSNINNAPTLTGNKSYYLNIGDTLNALIESKDVIAINPPPDSSEQDTTQFIFHSSDSSLDFEVVDSTIAERAFHIKFIADSVHIDKRVITASVIVHDGDSLFPGRNSYSYQIYVRKKLNLSLQITPLSCGFAKLKILGSSTDKARFLSMNKEIVLNGSQNTTSVNFQGDSAILKLQRNGQHYIQINDLNDRKWSIDIKDSFNYTSPILRILAQEGNTSICGDEDSTEIMLSLYNSTSDSVKYVWNKNNVFYSNKATLKTDSTANFNYEVTAGSCKDSGFVSIQKLQPLYGDFSEINLCKESCDSLNLLNFTSISANIIDSIGIKINHGNRIGLVGDNKFLPCATNTLDYPKGGDSLILRYNKTGNRCFVNDTLVINYIPKMLSFSDSSICYEKDQIYLNNLTSDDSFLEHNTVNFITLKNNAAQNNIVFNDNSSQLNKYYISTQNLNGAYTIVHQYQSNSCNFTDSFNIELKANPTISVLQSDARICASDSAYPLLNFTKDSATSFVLIEKDGQVFTGQQSQYLLNRNFIGNNTVGNYQIGIRKTYNNGCQQDSAISIEVLANPRFSIGPDLGVNNFDEVVIAAPAGYSNYQWNISNSQSRIIRGSAKELGLDSGTNMIICTVTDQNGCTASDTVFVNYRTSTNQIIASSINIYPNPSNGQIHIESPEPIQGIQLFSLEGKLLEQKYFEGVKLKVDYNLSNYSTASYILGIQASNQWIYQTIQIEKKAQNLRY